MWHLRTFTLQADGRGYVFFVTSETRIARDGTALKFSNLKAGQDAEVEMKPGPGGKASLLP